MPNIALSDAGLRAIQPPEKGTADYWDTNFKGFGVRVSQGGTKTFVLNIHKARKSLGRYGIVSLADARAEARRIGIKTFAVRAHRMHALMDGTRGNRLERVSIFLTG